MELTGLLHTLGEKEIQVQLGWNIPALQRTNTENSKQILPDKELRGPSPNFHFHVSVSNLYIPMLDLPILLQEICVCERFIHSHARSAYSAAGNMWDDPWNI